MNEPHPTGDLRRPEARSFAWHTLIPQHRRALRQLMELLQSAVERLPRPEHEPKDPASYTSTLRVDPRRASQLAFLDGGRGTGKTSVELSLRRALESDEGFAEMTASPPRGDAATAEEEWKALQQEITTLANMAGRLRPRLIWLTPLDMEPMPDGLNILAAILVRVAQAMIDFDHLRDPPGGWLARKHDDEPLWNTLQNLRTDVVRAWDGGMPGRSPAQRLRDWTEEVLGAEEARLDLNTRFSFLFARLAAHLRAQRRIDPLFVMVIDDFDLNPGLCVELLRVVRMITTPRLFFILAGDLSVASQVMRLKTIGDTERKLGAVHRDIGHSIASMAQEVSSNNLRKLVPPAHRVSLGPLPADEALAVHLPERRMTLEAALEEIGFTTEDGRRTIADIFLGPAPERRIPTRHTPRAHILREFFAVPIRVLLDTEMSFAAMQRRLPEPSALEVAEVLAAEIDLRVTAWGNEDLADSTRRVLREAIKRGMPSRALALRAIIDAIPRRRGIFCYYLIHDYQWVIKSRGDSPIDPLILPDAIGSGVAAMHDVRVGGGEPADRALLDDAVKPLGWVEHDLPGGSLEIVWPALSWDCICDAIVFSLLWSEAVEGATSTSTDDLLKLWLQAWVTTESAGHSRSIKTGFKGLFASATGSRHERRHRKVHGVRRRVQVLTMLAPEMGWPSDLVKSYVESDEVSHFLNRDDVCQLLRQMRIDRLRGVTDAARLLPLISPAGWIAFIGDAVAMLQATIEAIHTLPVHPSDDSNVSELYYLTELLGESEQRLRHSHGRFDDGDRNLLRRMPHYIPAFINRIRLTHPRFLPIPGAAMADIVRANFGAPWDLLIRAVELVDSPFNDLGGEGRAICPDLRALQRTLLWPTFQRITS